VPFDQPILAVVRDPSRYPPANPMQPFAQSLGQDAAILIAGDAQEKLLEHRIETGISTRNLNDVSGLARLVEIKFVVNP
jgi:hypothetical protein